MFGAGFGGALPMAAAAPQAGPPLTPLLAASKAGDVNGVQAALQSGEQAASANDGDRGALHYAAAGGHDTVVRGLVQANADVNQPSIKANATPLVATITPTVAPCARTR